MNASFGEKLAARTGGLCLYGLAPPKRATEPERLRQIAERQAARIEALAPDAVIVYDIQDEAERISTPRPFAFLPTVDPRDYAQNALATVTSPKIVYRSIGQDTESSLKQWLGQLESQDAAVLVGSPSAGTQAPLSLQQAYVQARAQAVPIGGIAIAERHTRKGDEHRRIQRKVQSGCSFFVTQAVYDVTATKSLISDLHLAEQEEGFDCPPLFFTFSPCASTKTLDFMQWLGVSFPRWLENDLRHSPDPLATSLRLCTETFAEIYEYASSKGIPVGVNVESVSVRKAEIDASIELFHAFRRTLRVTP